MAESRLIGTYPVIGIRPTIDGRRGYLKVRESLEEQTMNMARSAARLFEENLKYSNGILSCKGGKNEQQCERTIGSFKSA